ncbi:MAG: OmpH family outer membrane protein [Thermodesulfobacteriota bacterium]
MASVKCFLLALLLLVLPATVAAAGAVIIEDANLRSSPADTASIIAPLRRDTRVLALERQQEWVRVEVPSLAKSGWVYHSLLRENSGPQAPPAAEKKIIEAGPQKIPRKNSAKGAQPDLPLQNIGVIDIQQVLNQSRRGREARERFEEMRLAGQTEQLDRLEKEMVSHVIAEIQAIVEKYAGEKGFTHILNKNSGSVFYNEARFDITSDILREYDRQAALQQAAP